MNEKEVSRQIRYINREIDPLTQGVREKIVKERPIKLRQKVRLERSASTCIQRLVRGYILRTALNSETRHCWREQYDTLTGQNIFLNSVTNKKCATKPLQMKLCEFLSCG